MAFLPPPSSHRNSAFSLIEVLVAASIIGILAVMLLPVGKGILDRAATSKSISNLRQIGVGAAAYVSDHDGYLPSKDFNTTNTLWIIQLYELIYNKQWPNFVPYDTGINLKGTVFFSPNLKPNEPTPWRSYGWNNYMQTNTSTSTNQQTSDPLKLAFLAKPSRTVLCGDSLNASTLYSNKIAYRNQGKALILMADMHVEQMSEENLTTNASDPIWYPAR